MSIDIATPPVQDSVETEYRNRLAEIERGLRGVQRRQRLALIGLGVCAALLVVLLSGPRRLPRELITAAPAVAAFFCARQYTRSRRAARTLALRHGFYERGLQRVRLEWSAMDRSGEEFARPGHLYQHDLQILGERSLFSLLCTTRSEVGAERLADYLLDPADAVEARARQEAVRELRPHTALREQAALLGRYQFLGCDAVALREWLNAPALAVHPAVQLLLLVFGSAVLLLALLCLVPIVSWQHALTAAAPLLLAQGIVCLSRRSAVRERLKLLRGVSRELGVLRDGLELLESQSFTAAKLRGLVERSRAAGSAQQLRRLERLTWGVDQREKELFYLPSLLVGAGSQLVFAAERWRRTHQQHLAAWIDIWAEFDALNALGGYAWEHPAQVFPELASDGASLELRGMGHPLLPEDGCVRNDVALDERHPFWVLSGSNMAGKSTLLRAVGVNAVLALAGAPVRAAEARLAAFAVGASIGVNDALLDGKSKFLAEAERLQRILQAAQGEAPVLFLIDEILSGTNSHDRRVVCEGVVCALTGAGAVGILSTHDLALTQIAARPELRGRNCCMESEDPEEPLRFDYRVKPGVTRHSSALAIARMLGIDGG